MFNKSNSCVPDFETGSKYLRFRAHHLCCIQGFQGYGYSPTFVTNLGAVILYIKSFPSRPLKLVSECDIICASCPRKKECTAQKSIRSRSIRNMDLTVMDKLRIKEGTIIEAREAFSLLNSQLTEACEIEDICGTCKWKPKCLWFMQKTNEII